MGLLSFWTLSVVQYSKKLENTTFRKLDLFPSSGRGARTPSQLGPLERANLRHWTTEVKNDYSNINTWDQALSMGSLRINMVENQNCPTTFSGSVPYQILLKSVRRFRSWYQVTARRTDYLHVHTLRGFGPLANYADRATAASWRSTTNFLRIEGVAWSAQLIPPVVFSVFLTGAATISSK
jgi:hypothetical protein